MSTPSEPKGGKPHPAPEDAAAPLHPLVAKVVPDPDHPSDSVVLVGYLGSAGKGREQFRRIYIDSDFRTYYEIDKDDIHHAQKADPAAEEQPTNIYIKSTAKLLLVQTVEASFLTGPITSSYPVGSPAEQSWIPITTIICEIIICGGLPNTHGCSPGGVLITFGCGPGGILHTNRCKIGAVPPTHGLGHGGVAGPGLIGGAHVPQNQTCPPGGTPHTNHGCAPGGIAHTHHGFCWTGGTTHTHH